MTTNNAVNVGLSGSTGSGNFVGATSPTLVTPTIGVATATSVNKVAITAPATSATLTIADGKTLTVSNILTFTGTDSSSVAFGTGGTVLYNGGALGTPSSGTLTNCTGLPYAGINAAAMTDISGTVTVNGFSATSFSVVRQLVIGKIVFIRLFINGTSNATTFTITNMPNALQNTSGANINEVCYILDNGTAAFGFLTMAAGGTTITFYRDAAQDAWTNSGTKVAVADFWYESA
jgi:hypothetical protein